MPIILKQIERMISEASVDSMKSSGRLLELTAVRKLIIAQLSKLNGGPTAQFIPQTKYEKFNIEGYNKMMSEIKFDLDVLYELMVEKQEEILKAYVSADVTYKAQKSKLLIIKAALNELLFSSKFTDDLFYAVADTFTSVNRIDTAETTQGSVDLTEGTVSLPYSLQSAKRFQLGHLSQLTDSVVSIRSLDNLKVTGKNIGGSKPGDAFTDVSSMWIYNVQAETAGSSPPTSGVEMSITFPILPDSGFERPTRVSLDIVTTSSMTARLLYSNDNVNYIKFPGTQDKLVTEDSRVVSWDFTDTLCKYIRVVLVKLEFDAKGGTASLNNDNLVSSPTDIVNSFKANPFGNKELWSYIFNISSIAVYRLGRSYDAILQSKPLRTTNDNPIGAISIEVDEEISPRTSIDYYVSLADDAGNPRQFVAINPTNRGDNELPKTIRMGNTIVDSFDLSTGVTTAAVDTVTNNKITFYKVGNIERSYDYAFGSCKLSRGGNLWSRTDTVSQSVLQVEGNFIDFSDGMSTKYFYAYITEPASVINRVVYDGTVTKTFLKVQRKIINSPRVKPSSLGQDHSVDPAPDYAVAEVKHVRAVMDLTAQKVTPTGVPISVNGVSIPVANAWTGTSGGMASIGVPILLNGKPVDIITKGAKAPKLKYVTGGFTYIFSEGVDYVLKRSDDDYFKNINGWNQLPLHWRIIPTEPVTINVVSGSPLVGQFGTTGTFTVTGGNLPPITLGSFTLGSTQTLDLEFSIDPNITHRVMSVSYGSNEVELDGLVEVSNGDAIFVTYRYIPSNIIKQSIVVTKNPSNNAVTYAEGVDYIINTSNGSITRLPGGALSPVDSQTAYADFSYKEDLAPTKSYSIWCYVDSKEPFKFDYNPLVINRLAGESVTWTYTDASNVRSKDLDSVSSITLSKGWHFFTVKSLNPDLFNDCALIKTIKLRSITGSQLFLRSDYGGIFFTQMTAFRTPLRQISFDALKYSVLKSNHEFFALDDFNRIYVNFLPGSTTDLWYKRIDSAGQLVSVADEEFTFQGSRKLPLASPSNSVILKARLNRQQGTDGGLTPKLYSYKIKIGY